MFTTGNKIVDEMQSLNITGNVVPVQWFKTIVRANGKPNLNAIVILSDLAYWYKPRLVRDEATGSIKSLEKRFKSDLLQRSYQQLADQFGMSKREATNAIVELEKLGVVKRHLRNIKAGGIVLTNVLYLEIVPTRLKELTLLSQEAVSQSDTSHFEKGDPLTLESEIPHSEKGDPLTSKRETYTEITTKTTTKITNNIKDKDIKEFDNLSGELSGEFEEKGKEKELTPDKVSSTNKQNNIKKSIARNVAKSNDNEAVFKEFAKDDTELLEALRDFESMRKTIKKPLVGRAAKLLINKLEKEFPDRNDQIATLNQSMECNYLTVYPLKKVGSTKKPGKETTSTEYGQLGTYV